MSSKQVVAEDPPSFLFHFPSPYSTFNYEDDTSFLLQHLHDHHNYTTSITEAAVSNMADDHESNHDQCEDIGVLVNGDNDHGKTQQISVSSTKSSTTTKKVPRQRKIETARGPRGRRMRLSLEAAREFFHLQDMLGFDKASMTIVWLLNKSNAAIKELASSCSTTTTTGGANTSASSSTTTSKCCNEVVVSSSIKMVAKGLKPSSSRSTSAVAKKKKEVRARSKIALMNPMAIRESRAKARARARELTREKTRIRLHQSKVLPCSGAINSHLTQVRSWSPFVTGHQEQSHNLLGDWNSSIIFNYERDIGMSQEQYQSTGFQFNVNPTTT